MNQQDNKTTIQYDAFISYKRNGGCGWAALIYNMLNEIYGLNVFLDVETMYGGDWHEGIEKAIISSRFLIMVLFPNIENHFEYEKDDIFLEEVNFASKNNIPIIPFIAHNCAIEDFVKSAKFPGFVKDVINSQHCGIQYNHYDIKSTFDRLHYQLDPYLTLVMKSEGDDCTISLYDLTKANRVDKSHCIVSHDIKNGEQCSFRLDRNFSGMILCVCQRKRKPKDFYDIKFKLNHGGANKQSPYFWNVDKIITKEYTLRWLEIDFLQHAAQMECK